MGPVNTGRYQEEDEKRLARVVRHSARFNDGQGWRSEEIAPSWPFISIVHEDGMS